MLLFELKILYADRAFEMHAENQFPIRGVFQLGRELLVSLAAGSRTPKFVPVQLNVLATPKDMVKFCVVATNLFYCVVIGNGVGFSGDEWHKCGYSEKILMPFIVRCSGVHLNATRDESRAFLEDKPGIFDARK